MDDLVMLRRGDVVPWPGLNPRRRFDDAKVLELAGSIEENGVLQNITAHDRGEGETPRYWLVIGETRWRSVGVLEARGVEVHLPARVREFTEAQALKLALLENLQRNQLTPIEEALGFQHYLDINKKLTQAKLAEEFGIDPSVVSNRLRLLELPENVQQLVDEGRIAPSYARDLLVPWAKEKPAIRDRFFGALVNQISFASDFGVSVSRIWLEQTIERLKTVIKPEKAKPAGKKKAEPAKSAHTTRQEKINAAAEAEADADAAAEERSGADDASKAPVAESEATGAASSSEVPPAVTGAPAPDATAPEQVAVEPLTDHEGILTKVVISMLASRNITAVHQLRAARSELAGKPGYGISVMRRIDQVLAPKQEAGGVFGGIAALRGRYSVTLIATARDDGSVGITIGAKAQREGLPPAPAPKMIVASPAEIDAELERELPAFLEQLPKSAAA